MIHELIFPKLLNVLIKAKQATEWSLTKLEEADKYIYVSYGDTTPVADAVIETAEAMIDHDIFHLPSPVIWIEDPWDAWSIDEAHVRKICADVGRDVYERAAKVAVTGRHFYLCEELPDQTIKIMSATGIRSPISGKMQFTFYNTPVYIDLKADRKAYDPQFKTAIHAVKQFIVTLATAQAVHEKVPGQKWKRKQPVATRKYGYTYINIDTTRGQPKEEGGTGKKRKFELVVGYVWGKNTRPIAEQKWIAPYFRGDVNLGFATPKTRIVHSAHLNAEHPNMVG